jgi:peptide/nickel transport system substrate-binding protein
VNIERDLARFQLARTSISRRSLLRYSAFGSIAISMGGLLAACGDDDDDDDGGETTAPTATTGAAPVAQATATTGAAPAPGATATTASAPAPEATATESSQAPSGEQPQEGGTWIMALHGDPSTNVVQMPGALVDLLTFKVMYNNLVQYELVENSIELVPDLAEKWEANEDLSAYTFTIKQGVLWHDGTPFTVDDVKFTIETVLNPDNNASGRANISAIESVEVVDDTTITFNLSAPYAALPAQLGYNRNIFPKHLLEGADFANPAEFMANPVGTGPFKFKEKVQGDHLTTERFDDYFDGRPHLDGIIYKVIPDGNTRVAQMLSGDVHFAVIEPPQIQAVQGNDQIEVRLAPQVNYYFFAINHANPKFSDVRVRQALAHAVDRDAIIANILQGTGEIATGPINPLLGDFYNPDVTVYEYDLDKAAALLEEAGWTKDSDGKLTNAAGESFPILFNGPSINPIMVQVITYAQQQYQELGFDVTLDIVDWPVHLEKYRNQQYDLLMEWWITPPDPDLYNHYHTDGGNWWKYSNAEVDDLIVRARSEPDVEKRAELYHELQAVIADDVPIVYLYYPQEVQTSNTRVQNLPLIGYRDMLTWMEQVWMK